MFFVTGLIILITLVNIIVYYLRQRHEEEQTQAQRNNLSSPGLQCRRFSLAEIKWATQNFDAGLVIGKGGFGEVYKGIIDNGATTVAIKRLGFWSSQGAPEFWTEIEMLSKFRHSHLVSLIGYCNDHPEMIIVYEYMTGGTLADNLHRKRSHRPLSWIQRLKACLGAARGLDYLHTGTDIQTRVIHRDVKSTNILLDANCDAKISDFGLSKIGPAEQNYTHVSTRVKGTFGYMDPEYLWTRRLTRKSDVYAFGVVMLEALCGRPAVDRNLGEEQWGLVKWAKHCIKEGRVLEIVDPHLNGSFLSDCLEAFAQIAEQCLHGSSRKRPTMAEVVTRLEYALSLQEGTSLSLVDAGIITRGGNYDRQEGAGSPLEPDDKHAANLIQNQIQVTKKMTYVQKAWRFFSTKDTVISAYSSFQSPYLKIFSLAELKVATNKFSNKNILGRGGFGKVYKGRLLDGSLVAIKRQEEYSTHRELQFKNEIELSSVANHRNLLRLRGFCATESPSTERLLVYPYMANGSVVSLLRERDSALDWNTRKQIAVQAARGLAYLHDDCLPGIIHHNVKASKLLLDEDFRTYIGGFGLAKLMDHECTHVSTVCGTNGCIAPECFRTNKCSPKSDVFGYGMILLELIKAKSAFDLARLANDDDVMLLDWVRKLAMAKNLGPLVGLGEEMVEEMEQLIQVAVLCTHDSPTQRPKMSEVVKMLESEDGLSERWEEYLQKLDNPSYISWSIGGSISEEEMSPR